MEGAIPPALGKLSNLEVLWLQDNTSLMGALPQSLTGLTKLTQFYFNNTGLCTPLDAAFQTWIQGITDASGSYCALELSVCDRTNAVRDGIMALVPVSACGDVTGEHLSEINFLSLENANLTELKADDFSNLTGLTTLNLQENQLSSLPDGLFDDLTSLSWLYMGGNQLTTIPSELFTLSNLTELHLYNNRLEGVIPPALGTLSNLTVLDLGGNQLVGEIPAALGNLSNLTALSLHTNQLAGAIPPALGNLSNLTTLSLRGNQLTGEIPTELGNLSNLIFLYLSSNQLAGAIPPALGKLSNLEVLWLQDNTSLMGALPQSLTGLTKLTQFYFNNTGLCAPLDAAFQTWLQGITDAAGSNCSG